MSLATPFSLFSLFFTLHYADVISHAIIDHTPDITITHCRHYFIIIDAFITPMFIGHATIISFSKIHTAEAASLFSGFLITQPHTQIRRLPAAEAAS